MNSQIPFHFVRGVGEHAIFSYNIEKHQFIEYFQRLFNVQEFDFIHESCDEYIKFKKLMGSGWVGEEKLSTQAKRQQI